MNTYSVGEEAKRSALPLVYVGRRIEMAEAGAVLLLTGLGAALRVFQLGTQSLWLDEVFSVLLARHDWAEIVALTAQDSKPPLYYFFLRMALGWGGDEVAARIVSLLFSVATIPVFYLLARELFGRRAALLAALGLTLSPFHVLFAQEARMYAQLAFLLLCSVYFFIRAFETGATRQWALFALFMVLALYTHNLAILLLGAIGLFALSQIEQCRKRSRELVLAHVAIAILFAPWLFVVPQQAASVYSGFWGEAPSVLTLIATPYLFLFSNDVPAPLVPLALFSFLALLAFGVVAALRTVVRRQPQSSALMLTLSILIVPLAILYAISLIRPMYVERTLIASSFGVFMLLGWTVACCKPRALMVGFGGIALVALLTALPNYYFNPAMFKPPMRQAAKALVEEFHQGDAIAHASDSSALAFMYYAPKLPNQFLSGDPDYTQMTNRGRAGEIAGLEPADLRDIARGRTRVWLVVALDHNNEYQMSRVSEFDEKYDRVLDRNVGGIDLRLYQVER